MFTGSVSNGCQLLCELYQYHPTNTQETSPQNWVGALRIPSEITEESRDHTGEWARELFTKCGLAGSSTHDTTNKEV